MYRRILLELFIWRLHIEQPAMITLFVDTKVLDNHDAKQREGVESTYKKRNGFHPLHICWKRYIVDAIFRSGSVHGNHGTELIRAITRLTIAIRKRYRDVSIIVLQDSGFMDDTNFTYYEAFKHDVVHDVIPVACYPTTFRRQLIDFAVKVISRGGYFSLKVVQSVYDGLKLQSVWERIAAPIPIPVT